MRYSEPRFYYDDNNKRVVEFAHYKVKEKSKNYTAVYRLGTLITSRETFKSACKVAKLLEQAYLEGYNTALENY